MAPLPPDVTGAGGWGSGVWGCEVGEQGEGMGKKGGVVRGKERGKGEAQKNWANTHELTGIVWGSIREILRTTSAFEYNSTQIIVVLKSIIKRILIFWIRIQITWVRYLSARLLNYFVIENKLTCVVVEIQQFQYDFRMRLEYTSQRDIKPIVPNVV